MNNGRIALAIAIGMLLEGLVQPGTTAAAETQSNNAAIRSGDHQGFGRIIIDADDQARYQLYQDGDHVVMRFTTPMTLGIAPRAPRNVMDIKASGTTAELTVLHGASVRTTRIAGRVVLDVLDPSTAGAPSSPSPKPDLPASGPSASGPSASGPSASGPSASGKVVAPRKSSVLATSPELGGRSTAVAAAIVQPPKPSPEPPPPPPPAEADRVVEAQPLPADSEIVEMATQPPLGRDALPQQDGPVALVARRVRLPKGIQGSGFLVPFNATTGVAAFREGDDTYLVFDERRPVDMAALRDDPVFRSASVQMLPAGTLFRVPLPPDLSVAVGQLPQGWRIAALPTAPTLQPIVPSFADGRLTLNADQPSQVINLADPRTGVTLLVGTQHHAGQAVALGRRSTEFILRPTIQGVVVELIADTLVMKTAPTGFVLANGDRPLALSPATSATAAMINAAHLTRQLDFSLMRTDALVKRLDRLTTDAALSPPMARGPKRHQVAENMIALGLSAEAGSLLQVTAEQDPREAASPETAALTAIAALLAGRTNDAGALDDPRLNGTDEIALWRAVRLAMQDETSPAAAAVFSATAPLVLLYPQPIVDRILPLVIETMLQGGELAPAVRLLDQRKDDPKLAYARALQRQAEGDTDKALEMMDALAAGPDQFDRTRAAEHAVEMRLATNKIDKTQAADALDKLLYSWRGDDRELAMRERVADLRGQTGSWRVALSMLRQAEADFPEQAAPIHARLKDMFSNMIHSPGLADMPPMEFVAAVDENADLVPRTGDEQTVDQPLAEHLLALDLPDRAKPVLRKLLASATTDVAKARFGASLATIEAREKNDIGALADLDASEAPGLPSDLVEQRTMLRANVLAESGDPASATSLLQKLGTPEAAAARAQVQEDAKNWAAAEQAWTDCATLSLPASGVLDEAQTRTLLRLATATARAGDDAGLNALREKYDGRVGAGSLGDMFRLLTAEPIRTSEDIGRSKQEVSLAASLPTDLKALQANATAR